MPVSAIVHVVVPLPVAWRSVVGITIRLSLALFALPTSVKASEVPAVGFAEGVPLAQEALWAQESVREPDRFGLVTVKVLSASAEAR